jgi:hypothetical protein
MAESYHLQKRHPDVGGFRIGSLRGKPEPSVRTIERIMAINRQVYHEMGDRREKPLESKKSVRVQWRWLTPPTMSATTGASSSMQVMAVGGWFA